MSYAADIPEDIARSAHTGTSFAPEQRARQEREGYATALANDHAALAKLADTDEKRAILDEEFTRYRAGYRTRTLAYLASRSRCVSWMIAGPSRFPVARMEKRNAVADRRTAELVEYRERALAAIRKALRPELRPIMSGDDDASERLDGKVEAAERRQVVMKLANASIRKHAKAGADAQVAALAELGFAERAARALLTPDFCGRIGFADYEIKNNGANIRRMKERAAAVKTAQAIPSTETDGARARIEDAPAENRVRLFFPDKPAADVRARLKQSGFRWAPSIGCWQAYRNAAAIATARAVAEVADEPC